MAEQKITVEFNPNEAPSATSVDIVEKPNIATRPTNLRQVATIGLIANAGRQFAMSTLGQVGAITGNAQAQRTINKVSKLATIGASFAINPIAGALTLASTLGTEAVGLYVKQRNENNSAVYYSRINGGRTNKGRIVWFIQ